MKRIISLILVVCMACAVLAACNKTTTTPTITAPNTQESTATKTPEAFSVNKETAIIFKREKVLLSTNDTDEVTWTSSDSTVATVDKDGMVTGIKDGTASITVQNKKGEKDVCKVTVIDATKYFTIADYKTITIEQSKINDEIIKEFKEMSEHYKTTKAVDREIKKGDVASIYYVGTLDGETEPFSGGTGSYDLEIGSGAFIPGFEDGLIGAKKGETVDVKLTFPEDYGEEGTDKGNLNGKKVTFVVTINAVSEYVPAEINDELIKKATNSTYSTVKEYTQYLNSAIREYLAIEAVIEASEIKGFNDEMLENYKQIYLQNTYGYYASMYGVAVETYIQMIGKTMEDANKEAEDNAKPYIEQLYLCYTFYENNEVTISEEKANEILLEYAKLNQLEKVEDLLKYLTQADLDNHVLIEYALESIVDSIKVVNNIN